MPVLLSVMTREMGGLKQSLPKIRDDMRSVGLQVDFHKFQGSHDIDQVDVRVVTNFLRLRIPRSQSSAGDVEQASMQSDPTASTQGVTRLTETNGDTADYNAEDAPVSKAVDTPKAEATCTVA